MVLMDHPLFLNGDFGFSSVSVYVVRVHFAEGETEAVVVGKVVGDRGLELRIKKMFSLLGTRRESLRKGFPVVDSQVTQILISQKHSPDNFYWFLYPGERRQARLHLPSATAEFGIAQAR